MFDGTRIEYRWCSFIGVIACGPSGSGNTAHDEIRWMCSPVTTQTNIKSKI